MAYVITCNANQRSGHIAIIHDADCEAAGTDPGMTLGPRPETLRSALDLAVDIDDRHLGYGDSDAKLKPCVKESL